jgi:hypothetical protein
MADIAFESGDTVAFRLSPGAYELAAADGMDHFFNTGFSAEGVVNLADALGLNVYRVQNGCSAWQYMPDRFMSDRWAGLLEVRREPDSPDEQDRINQASEDAVFHYAAMDWLVALGLHYEAAVGNATARARLGVNDDVAASWAAWQPF